MTKGAAEPAPLLFMRLFGGPIHAPFRNNGFRAREIDIGKHWTYGKVMHKFYLAYLTCEVTFIHDGSDQNRISDLRFAIHDNAGVSGDTPALLSMACSI